LYWTKWLLERFSPNTSISLAYHSSDYSTKTIIIIIIIIIIIVSPGLVQ
jgi:hypothetical protein